MSQNNNRVVNQYTEAYRRLYKRSPSDIQTLDRDWIIVNGARMRISELEFLTHQLEKEYEQTIRAKKSVVSRLIKWFRGD